MSRSTWDTSRLLPDFAYGTFTPCGRTFQTVPLSIRMPCRGPATPSRKRDGLGCSAFARHYLRNHYCFLFLRLLRCFTSPGIALMRYFIHTPITEHYLCWVFPFGNLRIKRLFAPIRSLSQLTTSFIAYQCQGIHRAPLVA